MEIRPRFKIQYPMKNRDKDALSHHRNQRTTTQSLPNVFKQRIKGAEVKTSAGFSSVQGKYVVVD